MRTANDLAETTETLFKHREWRVIPDTVNPNWFKLEEIKTGKVLGCFVLPEDGDPTLLNRIAAAPELEDIAEMFRDTMIGNKAEKTMVFSLVMEVLQRAAQPYPVALECV